MNAFDLGLMKNCFEMISEPILDHSVGVCLTPQSHGTQRGHCVCMGGVCDVPHRIGEKVPDTIYIETHFNQVDAF